MKKAFSNEAFNRAAVIPVGDCKRPVAAAKVVEKYLRNAQEVVAADVAKRTAGMLLDIETLASIRPVLDLLAKRS